MSCTLKGRPLNDILPYIMPSCTVLPEEMALDYGRRAYIEFARRSGGLVATLVYDIQEGVQDYPLETPVGYLVSRVNWVELERYGRVTPSFDQASGCGHSGSSILHNFAGGAMNGSYGYGPNSWACCCGPYKFHMEGYNCLVLHMPPRNDCQNGIHVQVALLPTQDVCVFDSEFFDRWVEGIAYGALSKAMRLPNTDWFDLQLADKFERLFIAEIQRARHKYEQNYTRGTPKMQARRFV